ncbi:MAG TPA: hypothetical protein VMX33_03910 [bacterium]|nr:hypothetical protein [bacterium]
MTVSAHRQNGVASGFIALMAIAVSALAASCWHPTFDPMLSASEATVQKLGDPTVYFTAENVQQWGLDNAWFLPPMVDTPAVGLLVMDMGAKLAFRSIPTIDTINHTGWVNTASGFEIPNTMSDAYLAYAAPDGSSNAFVSTHISEAQIVQMSDLSNSSMVLPGTNTQGSFGIGVVAESGPTATIACYAYDALSLEPEYETRTAWSGGTPTTAFTIDPGTVLAFSSAAQVTVPGKFLAAGTYLYLSCGLSDGSRTIFRWALATADTIEPIQYTEDYGPLIGALSDGRLLAERDGIISVLDANLVRLFKFPAGTLRFVHERYDSLNARMKVVFTRTFFVKTSTHDDIGTLKVEIYEIPTADLANLAD